MQLWSLPKSISLLTSFQVSLEQEEKEDLKGIAQARTCVHVHTYIYTNVVIAAQCTVTMVPLLVELTEQLESALVMESSVPVREMVADDCSETSSNNDELDESMVCVHVYLCLFAALPVYK